MMPVENEEDKVTVAPEDYLVPDSIKAVRETSFKNYLTSYSRFSKGGKNRHGNVPAFYQAKSPEP